VKPLRIAFSGKAGSGKDYSCDHMISILGGTKMAFADALVGGCKALHHFYGLGYEKDRELLQHVGDWARRRDENVFIRNLVDRLCLSPDDNVFVSDVRFRNEAIALRAMGFALVRINPPQGKAGQEKWQVHKSEIDLDDWDGFDFSIVNCKEAGHLEECLSVLYTAVREDRHKWSPHRTTKIT
jgi:hypothetical protein